MEAGAYRGLSEQKIRSLLQPSPNPYLDALQPAPVQLQAKPTQTVKISTGGGGGSSQCLLLLLLFALGLLVGIVIAFCLRWLAR